MVELRTEVDTRKLERAIRHFPAELSHEMEDAFDHIARKFLKRFRNERLQGPPGIRGRRGGIFTRFNKKISVLGRTVDGMSLSIYTTSKIAQLHETGGTISDPRGGKIAVPLSARSKMFTKTGRLRKRYKDPRSLKNVIPMQFNGKTFLARIRRRKRKEDKIEPLYVLKKRVRVPARLGFYKVWDDSVNDRIKILNKAVEKAIKAV